MRGIRLGLVAALLVMPWVMPMGWRLLSVEGCLFIAMLLAGEAESIGFEKLMARLNEAYEAESPGV